MKEIESTHSGSQKAKSKGWLSLVVEGKKEFGEQSHMEPIYFCVKTESEQCVQCVTLHQAIILCVSRSSAIVKLLPLAKPSWGSPATGYSTVNLQ